MTVRSARAAGILRELPAGTIELGRRSLRAANRRLGPAFAVDCSASAVEAHLVRPVELADDWPDPSDPLPVGHGAVHADLIDDDRELFGSLRAALTADRGTSLSPEMLAIEAQACRLPVTAYRRRPATPPSTHGPPASSGISAVDARSNGDPSSLRVVDLTALWAGPLATSLLAEVGVEVIKVDPSCRPDAFAEHPRLYRYLNDRKDIVDLDLRSDDARRRFEILVTSADLVVDSFSRRVMPNLGYGPEELRSLQPSLATMSLVAFDPCGPHADWVAYGPGVHAMSGLAELKTDDGDRSTFRAAPIAYPDALAGFEAFAVAVDLLLTPKSTAHRTVALSKAIEPLVDGAPAGRTHG